MHSEIVRVFTLGDENVRPSGARDGAASFGEARPARVPSENGRLDTSSWVRVKSTYGCPKGPPSVEGVFVREGDNDMRASRKNDWNFRLAVHLVALSLAASSFGVPVALAQQAATMQGVITGADGKPGVGFKAVFKNLQTGKEIASSPSNVKGEYSVPVPTGTRYEVVAAIAPDGTRLPVKQVSPTPVRVPGTYTLNIVFQPKETQRGAAGVPWYKTGWAITGYVVVGGVVLYELLKSDESSSPSKR